MTSSTDGSGIIQTTSRCVPCPPPWFGEVALLVEYLRKQGVLAAMSEQVRFARGRAGHDEVSDFLAVQIARRHPWGTHPANLLRAALPLCLALHGALPARAPPRALAWTTVAVLRQLFLEDLLSRPLSQDRQTGGLLDRAGTEWEVFDIDGTREAARQRALPKGQHLPPAHPRLQEVCAKGYTGRKRGEVVRTRTVVSQAHDYQWLGSFGNPGNGTFREDLRRAVAAIKRYLAAYQLSQQRALLRLDGQYGTGAVLCDLAGFADVSRGKDYQVLDHPTVGARVQLPADQQYSRPESALVRTLYDCPAVPVGPAGEHCRVVVATHPKGKTKSRVGVERAGVIYELFFTDLPQQAFTAADVVALYLHRGAFDPQLADEDQQQDPDRWGSHAPAGQEAWQMIWQWVWNLRLELGHVLEPTPVRTTEVAPALQEQVGSFG